MKQALLITLGVILSTTRAELNFLELFQSLQEFDLNKVDWDGINESLKAFYRSLPSGDDIHGNYNTLEDMSYSREEMDLKRDQAVQRTLGIRRKLGMKRLGQGEEGDPFGADGASQSGYIAAGIGAVDCLTYSAASGTNCRNSAEGLLIGYDTLGEVISKVYMPWYWPDGMMLSQDLTALGSMMYTDCSVDKLMTTLTHIPTVEGATSLLSRTVVAYNVEIAQWMAALNDPRETSHTIGCKFGKAFGAVTKWNI
jgi:hypothetical protein